MRSSSWIRRRLDSRRDYRVRSSTFFLGAWVQLRRASLGLDPDLRSRPLDDRFHEELLVDEFGLTFAGSAGMSDLDHESAERRLDLLDDDAIIEVGGVCLTRRVRRRYQVQVFVDRESLGFPTLEHLTLLSFDCDRSRSLTGWT